jgi:histone deacetylase complex subunit SAP18
MAKLSASSSSSGGSKPPGNDDARKLNAMDMELDDDQPHRDGRHGSGGAKGSGRIDEKSLDDYGFITGDLLSVSLFVPEPKAPLQRGSGPVPHGALAMGGGGPAGPGVQSFGWKEAQSNGNVRNGNGIGHPDGPERERPWGRGGPLPPQEGVRGGRGGFGHGPGDFGSGGRGGFGRDERERERERDPAGGGNWRGGPIGIRGAGGRRPRSRSPDLGRNKERDRNADRSARRSRSRSKSRSRSRSPVRRR